MWQWTQKRHSSCSAYIPALFWYQEGIGKLGTINPNNHTWDVSILLWWALMMMKCFFRHLRQQAWISETRAPRMKHIRQNLSCDIRQEYLDLCVTSVGKSSMILILRSRGKLCLGSWLHIGSEVHSFSHISVVFILHLTRMLASGRWGLFPKLWSPLNI